MLCRDDALENSFEVKQLLMIEKINSKIPKFLSALLHSKK